MYPGTRRTDCRQIRECRGDRIHEEMDMALSDYCWLTLLVQYQEVRNLDGLCNAHCT